MMAQEKTPWYTQPLVWMLIFIPFSAVVGGIVTIYLAIDSQDGLVKDDYYSYGKQINRVLERDEEARRLGLAGQLSYNPETGQLLLSLDTPRSTPPAVIRLQLQHATRAGFDVNLELVQTADGKYVGLVEQLTAGHWYIELSQDDWRLTGEFRHPGETRVTFP